MTHWIISLSILIVAVLLIRAVGGDRLSARLRYALWGLVLLRLLVPVSIGESALSVQNWMPKDAPGVQSTQPVDLDVYASSDSEEILNITQPEALPSEPVERAKSMEILPILYGVGCVIVGAVFLWSNVTFALRLRRSRRYLAEQQLTVGAVPVYETAAVDTPCLFGFPRAAVYLTPDVMGDDTMQRHVLAHELTHYRHGDHLWSLLRCVAVTLHWYNPLVWAAAIASQKDGELACDEGALRRLGSEERTDYARTLLGLTCVGYRGVLTAATSMTGSESDLKKRIKRIVANPKMTAAAVIVVAAAMLLTGCAVFTDAKKADFEGLWRMDVAILGVGVDEDATAYMEYEFCDGRGIRVDYIDGEIRSAEHFTYTLNGETVTLEFPEIGPVRDYTWTVDGDTLTLADQRAEMHLTKVERKSVPYLPDGAMSVYNLRRIPADDDTMLHAELTNTEQVQLLALLRSGTVEETRKEVASNLGHPLYGFTVDDRSGYMHLSVGGGLVYDNDKDTGYALSNIGEIEAWLEALPWEGEQFNANMETSGFVPADMVGIAEARMILYGKAYSADPARLAFLEELLSTAVDMGYPTACPFEGYLEVTLSDGRVLAVVPALDSCSAFMIGDTCYEYGNQFAYDDEGSYDNTELLAVFGLNHDVIMELWEAEFGGEVIGTTEDIGDVVRVMNDVMEPARLTDEQRETMIALLAEGLGDAVGEEKITYKTTYYTIISSGLETQEGVVTLSDMGRLYMDGVRYELTTADELLALLDGAYGIYIVHDGLPVEADWQGTVGEDVYFELWGVPEGAEVTWISNNKEVCTVEGDAYGATVSFKKLGEARIIASCNNRLNNKGYSIGVDVFEKFPYASNISEEDLRAAEELARKDYEALREEDYCIRLDVLESVVTEGGSQMLRMEHEGNYDGWIAEYLAENFVAVKVTYDCAFDREKTFRDQGTITKYTLLIRDGDASPWRIWKYADAPYIGS